LQFQIIKGHIGVNRKLICNFMLVINSNFGRISYRFRDIVTISSSITCFPNHNLVWWTLAEEGPAIST